MGAVIYRRFDWIEDMRSFDLVSAVRKAGGRGRWQYYPSLSWRGWMRRLFGIRKPSGN